MMSWRMASGTRAGSCLREVPTQFVMPGIQRLPEAKVRSAMRTASLVNLIYNPQPQPKSTREALSRWREVASCLKIMIRSIHSTSSNLQRQKDTNDMTPVSSMLSRSR